MKDYSMLTDRFDDAFCYAHRLHRSQMRKGTLIPYIAHLMTVAALVVEHGGDEDQAIGGLLHDAAEDQGGVETLEDISGRFGDAVGTRWYYGALADVLAQAMPGGLSDRLSRAVAAFSM